MNFYVADTHALFWYLINSSALGADARLAFDEADAGQALIYIPAIVIAELYYLNEKKGRPFDSELSMRVWPQPREFFTSFSRFLLLLPLLLRHRDFLHH